MLRQGWVCVGSAGVLGLQLLLIACGNSEKHPVVTAGGADSGDAGQNSSGKTSSSGSAGKASGGAAHGGSSSVGPGDASDLDTFLEAEGEGFCARLFRCVEGNDDFTTPRIVLKNEQGCKDLLARVNANSRSFRDLRAQMAAGNIHYDPEDGQKCLDDLSACNGADSLSDGACREAFEGNAKTGEACVRSEDCAGDAYCDSIQGCGGQCAPRKQEGEPCQSTNECAYTTGVVFCDHSTTTAVCHTLAPTAKAAEGEPCTRDFEGAQSLTLCQDGLWCQTLPGGDPSADVLGRCALPIPVNGACVDGDDACRDGVCDTTAGACRSVTLVATAGASCNKTTWSVCDPTLGFHCNTDGTCDGSGDGSAGSACFGSDLQRGCDAGLYCAKPDQSTSNDPGICRAFVADGAACNNSQECASGNCTDSVCGGRPCLQ
jgi:hypothetical protein